MANVCRILAHLIVLHCYSDTTLFETSEQLILFYFVCLATLFWTAEPCKQCTDKSLQHAPTERK